MSACAATSHAEMVGIDAKFLRVESNKADGAMHVLDNFRDLKFRLRTMQHREDGVAPFQKRLIHFRKHRFLRRVPAAADHENNSKAIGFFWLKNIESEGRAELASINNIFGSREVAVGLPRRNKRCGKNEQSYKKFSHARVITIQARFVAGRICLREKVQVGHIFMPQFNCRCLVIFAANFFLIANLFANKAIINSDLVLEIDGKKVFPIGFTLPPPVDGKTPSGKNAIQELADAGATFLRAGPLNDNWDANRFAQEKKVQDAAAKYGMHCWLALREAASIQTNDLKHEELLRKIVMTFKDHPGMGVYKGVDEPEWGKSPVPPMQGVYEIVKQLDPNHPLALIEAPRGEIESLKKYNPVCDILGFDVYPIAYPPGQHSQFAKMNSEISMIGDYTKRAVEITEGKKSVWMTLQISWSGILKPGKTLRFPTFPEQRFMVYQAIINGARGLMFFGGGGEKGLSEQDKKLGWNWKFWNRVLRPVIEEIGTKSPIYPALVVPNSKLPVKVKGDGIEFCVREIGPEIFVLACKRSHTTEEVEFTGLPATTTGGEMLFEEPRQVEIKNGAFKDWFAPFEVHVYRFRRN